MNSSKLENDLLLKALRGEAVNRPPVWMMRQAGRYLPEYIALRNRYDFFTRVQTPELACEITIQPIDIIGTDAAILFSDILVIPQALGVEVLMEEGKGPQLPNTIQTASDIAQLLPAAAAAEKLNYVYDAIKLTKQNLHNRVPLIGFAGAPWTILCYMIEGKGSKTWDKAKQFIYTEPKLAHSLLQKITDATILYLQNQVSAGADAIQVFDSWAGCLSPDDFNEFAMPYLKQITQAISKLAPTILFPKGSWYALKELAQTNASAIGIDWCITASFARRETNNSITLQGNFDPAKLLAPIPQIQQSVKNMIDAFGKEKYIVNLGHGITPNVPVAHAKAFVDAVKNYQ